VAPGASVRTIAEILYCLVGMLALCVMTAVCLKIFIWILFEWKW
jgi:hypothetical protein